MHSQTVCVAVNQAALKLVTEAEDGSGTTAFDLGEGIKWANSADCVAFLVDFEIARAELEHSDLGSAELWPEHSELPAQHETQILAQSAAQLHP